MRMKRVGAATAIALLLPGVGTLLVWVPIGAFLAATSRSAKAILKFGGCALSVVGISDYVIRPKLVSDENTPAPPQFSCISRSSVELRLSDWRGLSLIRF